jgi:tRNA-Thr(GGU) m(6)t(6)A37 methyltransferase TsaA
MKNETCSYSIQPIGFIRSEYKEKFGVPRQSMMVKSARGVIRLNPIPEFEHALKELEQFSHIWILYWFDRHLDKSTPASAASSRVWTPTIRPPRLDGPERVGVLASRSPDRPNPIGLSAVKLDSIDFDAPHGIELHISGIDILDQTPVLDIKPYLPFADRIDDANSGWAEGSIPTYPVHWTEQALQELQSSIPNPSSLQTLIEETLSYDPRPTSQRAAMPLLAPEQDGREFAFRISKVDVHWRIEKGSIWIIRIQPLTKS